VAEPCAVGGAEGAGHWRIGLSEEEEEDVAGRGGDGVLPLSHTMGHTIRGLFFLKKEPRLFRNRTTTKHTNNELCFFRKSI
jgi:hypothetical protein